MSFFHRACKTDITAAATQHPCPRSDQRVLRSPQIGHLAWCCALGVTALAGLAFYAIRKPRIPQGVQPLSPFDLSRFCGRWYELARVAHGTDHALQRTQTEYSLLRNGDLHLTTRGYDPRHNEWRIAHGTAKPAMARDVGALKVSLLGPFYRGFNVVALDDDYQWAMAVGAQLDECWILSRTPTLPQGVQERLLQQAALLGVNTQTLCWTLQDGVNPTGSYK